MNETLLHTFLSNFGLTLLIFLALLLIFMIIFEIVLSKKESDEYIAIKNHKRLLEEFYDKLDVVSTQSSKEVLESLIEMQDLDKLYDNIIETKPTFIDEISYLRLKESTLNKIISEKIKTIEEAKRKKEKYKALLDEIKGCKERYPQYNEVFVKNINIIEDKIG